jgi:lipopolysaccharide transport system ATP-binding protein
MLSDGPVMLSVEGVSRRYQMVAPAQQLKTMLVHPLQAFRASHHHKDLWAVRDVTFQVRQGEFFSIIGANGSGKSTLLRLLAGLSQPTAGRVIAHGSVSTLLELGSGFHPNVSGRENAILNGLLIGMNRRDVERLIPEIVEFAGLQEFIDQPMRTYSSGMYVRLGFAMAAFMEPKILLVDEVLAVGDARFQEKCYDHIARLQAKGVTIVMVSHDLGAVERFSDRAGLMERGRMVEIGEPRRIVATHVERLASTSPEIKRAVDEAIDQDPEALKRRLEEDPEALEAFNRALAKHPEYLKKLAEAELSKETPQEPH